MNTTQTAKATTRKLTPYDRIVTATILAKCDDQGACTLPVRELADLAGLSPRGVQKIIYRLEGEGVIDVERRTETGEGTAGHLPNIYRVNLDALSQNGA